MSDLPAPEPPAGHRLVSLADEPDRWDDMERLGSSAYAELMFHDPVANRLWHLLRDAWPDLQLSLVDPDGRTAAIAQSAPLAWDGTDAGLPDGWDEQFRRSEADRATGRVPNTLGAIQIVVAADRRGQGLSRLMLDALRGQAARARFRALIACVRPTEKERYPLLPIETYAAWRRDDGLPFDPWLRVHARLGGRIVRPSPRSMTIEGSVGEWQVWTGLEFPASGPYVAAGALGPVEIDLASSRGVYYDPNVWLIHDLRGQAPS